MPDHPPMTPGSLDEPRSRLEPHEHAVCVYDLPAEMETALGAFLEGGVVSGETSVFVHAYPDDAEAWAAVLRAYPDGERLRASGFVLVQLYRDAFEGEGLVIDHERVGRIVGALAEEARRGSRGLRIFVDASRIYLSGGRLEEWFAFEEWLGRRLQAAVGLVCAYRREDVMRPELLPRVLSTHAYRFDARA